MNFKKGDKVKFMGVESVVVVDDRAGTFNIQIQANNYFHNFTSDGRYFDWHTEPSLKLVECGEGNCEFKIEVGSYNVKCCRCGKEKPVEKPEKKTVRYYLKGGTIIQRDDEGFYVEVSE